MRIEELAREESPRGFDAFYTLVHNKAMPDHSAEWITDLFEARKKSRGQVVFCFRGGTKSTTYNTFVAWRAGVNPTGASLIIRASEQAARESAEKISDLIANNAGFRAVFPNVIPDKAKGWSQSGYEVMRNDMPYEDWRRLNSNRMDPSIMALPYGSNAIPGMHPDNVLLCDDLETQDNTASDRELQTLKRTLAGTIMPTATKGNPWTIFIGTPWVSHGVLQAVEATGEYSVIYTPVAIDGSGKGKWPEGKLTWPEGMPAEAVEAERRRDITGGPEFARMFLLDLSAAQNRTFQYQTYPNHLINTNWPIVGGVDYAGVIDPTRRDPDHSHYALAYVVKLPEGGAVVYDGVLEQWSQAESETSVDTAQSVFPNWQHAVVEGDGKGEEFIAVLMRHPHLRLVPMKTGGRSKAERLVNQLGPWLRTGRVRISDAETKFLTNLRGFLNNYPNVSKHDPGWDAADSVYWALRGMPDVLVVPTADAELPSIEGRARTENPFASLGVSHV